MLKLTMSLRRAVLTLLLVPLAGLLTACSSSPDNLPESPYISDQFDASEMIMEPPADLAEAQQRALSALQSDKPELAVVEYLRALAFEQNQADIYFNIALIQEQFGNTPLAAQAYQEGLGFDAKHLGNLEGAGITLARLGKTGEGRRYLQRAMSQYQTRYSNHTSEELLAMLNAQSRPAAGINSERSEAASQVALREIIVPQRAMNALGVLEDLDGNHTRARDYFSQALVFNPDDPQLHNNLGYSYYASSNYAYAEKSYLAAIAADHDYQRAWSNLGLLYVKWGKYNKALSTLSRGMSKAEAYNDIGYLLMLEGDYATAVMLLQKAIDESPTYYPRAQSNLEIAQDQLALEATKR